MAVKNYINKASQKGFTLIELMIALAIGAILLAGLTGALYQLLASSSSNTNNIMALNQVQSAGYWISKDVKQSKLENIVIDNDTSTSEIFSIAWDELSFDTELIKTGYKVIYRLDNRNLYRDYYKTNGNLPYETLIEDYTYSFENSILVAQYIDSSISLVKSDTVTLTIAATIDGWKAGSAERVYIIENRLK
jgi:prepilin-type N-terminal cleavage/methylation domain-containing protein